MAHKRVEQEFAAEVREIFQEIRGRMTAVEDALYASRAFIIGSQTISRKEWATFQENQRFELSHPGTLGVGLALEVRAGDLDAYIRAIRAEDGINYEVWPAGERPAYALIRFTASRHRDLRALGFDMYSEPTRRVAFERARDSGQAVLSGVTRVKDGAKMGHESVLLVLPYYGDVPAANASVDQRRAAVRGYVYCPLLIGEFMLDLAEKVSRKNLAVRITDGDGSVIFSSSRQPPQEDALLSTTLTEPVYGRTWTMRYQALPGFGTAIRGARATFVAAYGFVIAFLLAIIVWTTTSTRLRAEKLARSMTRDLRESEQRLRELADTIQDVFWSGSPDYQQLYYVSSAYEKIWGRSLENLRANPTQWIEATVPEDRSRVLEALDRLARGGPYDLEYRIRRPDGAVRWIHGRGFVVRDGQAKIVRTVGAASDITDRKLAEQRVQESEAKYRQLIEQASDGIFVSDAQGNFILVNSRGCELLGYTEQELLGMNGRDTYLEEERHVHAERMQRVGTGEVLRFERMVRRKNGSVFPAEVSIKKLDNGTVQVIFHDITMRRTQEQKIARLSRIQGVLSGINSAIVRIRDRQQLFDEACRIAARQGAFHLAWIGLRDEVSQMRVVAWAGKGAEFFAGLVQVGGLTFSPQGVALRAIHERRTIVDNDILANPGIDAIRRKAVEHGCRSVIALPLVVEDTAVGALTFYSEEKGFFDQNEIRLLEELAGDVSFALTFIEQQERAEYLAYYDSLTGLPNGTLLYDRLGQKLKTAQRDARMAALILLDLERFHTINDTLGRSVGDELIKEIATRLRTQVRGEDTVARVAGDVFAIVLTDLSSTADVAHFVRDRILNTLREPVTAAGQMLRLSTKLGIAVYPSDGGSAETLHSSAEAALKNAKSGTDPFLFYAPEMNATVAESLTLENKLRNALEQGHFVLHYQPKIAVQGGGLTGLEALIRWKDPDLGLISPGRFIPLMEKTGLILDAGRWALAQVARDCAQWTKRGLQAPRVAVNVSAIQLRQKDFVEILDEAARQAREAGGALDLEITESVIVENLEDTIRKLQIVRGLGVNIAVDDFGTGYSSLAYLARLPIHALKIDRSFVVGMTEQQESLAIVKSIISLAHSLKLQVVAEGVETEEQAALLEQLGCDQLQGYLVSQGNSEKPSHFVEPMKECTA